ncbi:hypothetical protein [Halalkalibacter nanhaiisediminis]|uniref:Uncharacterized protein n=1 Tax=Halalkalibacter nanhaiisediminis TaxID=688079 RepID=A0A562QQ65_9BACI|nr:hypothetical protein [Halalkalibacter nanhaiisediminis]TWI58902.1 hypothetical protein IQ10_00610 [Halalkalibacter nanhaiisediminis]
MLHTNETNHIACRFQQDKEEVALLRRDGFIWHQVLPLSIHQTMFPTVFQLERKD